MRSLILSVLLCSCGLPGDLPPVPVTGKADAPQTAKQAETPAGSRLRPLWLVGSDGTRLSAGWFYDTQRAENCVVQLLGADTGVSYCAPVGKLTAQTAGQYVQFRLQ